MKSNFRVLINTSIEIPVDFFKFSGGEIQVRINAGVFDPTHVIVIANIRDSDGIMALALLTDALERKFRLKHKKLIIPYLPYSRQDRVCADGEALSLKIVCNIINSMKYDEVATMNCHSDVGVALLDNCTNTPMEFLLNDSQILNGNCVLVSPDAGANKKILDVAKHYNKWGGRDIQVIRADKTRCTNTGAITGTEVYASDLSGKTAVILDDIADGGGTFIALAQELKKLGAEKVILYVTHGIFSKGVDVLLDSGIDQIYTSNPWYDIQNENVFKI